jgi:MFS superfamily sulfate permease-like transporter
MVKSRKNKEIMKNYLEKFFLKVIPQTKADWLFVGITTAILVVIGFMYKYSHPATTPRDIICLVIVVGGFLYIHFVNRSKNMNKPKQITMGK